VKDETSIRHAGPMPKFELVDNCGQPCYQLDQGDAVLKN